MVAKDSWVWEFDPATHQTKDNPGYGPCAGKVVDPYGATLLVEWADGQTLSIPRTMCRQAMPEGTVFLHDGVESAISYTTTGVVLKKAATAKKGKKKRKAAAKKRISPKKRKVVGATGVEKKAATAKKGKKKSSSPKKTKATKRFKWRYIDPISDKSVETTVAIPGLAFDTVFQKVITVHAYIKTGGYVRLADGSKRNTKHVRALTIKETEKYSSTSDDDEAAGADIGADWAPLTNVPALDVRVQSRLSECIGQFDNKAEPLYHLFVERVAKVYINECNKQADDSDSGMHADRESICHQACERVMSQIPIRQRPHKGSIRRSVNAVLPIIEQLFDLPARGPDVGSEEWFVKLEADTSLITFRQMSLYPRLLKAYVKWTLNTNFNAKGELRLENGEVVPTSKYDPEKAPASKLMIKSTRRSMARHKDFKFLRAGAVVWAFDKLREAGVVMEGLYPLRMHPDTLPKASNRKSWNNFNQTRVTFVAYYCDAQGN